jgi:hypothetical protein
MIAEVHLRADVTTLVAKRTSARIFSVMRPDILFLLNSFWSVLRFLLRITWY